MKHKRIETIQELKDACLIEKEPYVDFSIVLGGGLLSSKSIHYNSRKNTFTVINDSDSSIQENLTEKQLKTKTNIVEAIERGAFFRYPILE